MKGYVGNIEKDTLENGNYRKVLFTGPNLQLVVMTLRPGEEIGEETHDTHDQFFRIEQGSGQVMMDGEVAEIGEGFGTIVPAGTRHNVINTGERDLKLYTIYAPPQHKPGTIHATKDDASQAEKAEENT